MFGLGACAGALSIGTVLANAEKMRLVRIGLLGFAVMMAIWGLLRSPAPAYPVVFVLGAVYFGTTTAMLTVLQTVLTDRGPGSGHGTVVHGLRRDGGDRRARLRPPPRRHQRHGRPRHRRDHRRPPGVVVRPAPPGPTSRDREGLAMLRAVGDGLFGEQYGSAPGTVLALPGWMRLARRLPRRPRRARRAGPRPAGLRRRVAAAGRGGGGGRATPRLVAPALDACADRVVVVGHSFGGRVAVQPRRTAARTGSPPSS